MASLKEVEAARGERAKIRYDKYNKFLTILVEVGVERKQALKAAFALLRATP